MGEYSTRLYRMPDDDVLIAAMHRIMVYDQFCEGFEKFHPSTFHTDFVTEFEKCYDEAQRVDSDKLYRLDCTDASDAVTEQRESCYETAALMAYFIKAAGRGDKAFLRQFQLKRITKARINTTEMLLFAEDLLYDINQNRNKLFKSGFRKELIPELQEKRRELAHRRQKQENAQEKRKRAKAERIEKHNKVWEYIQNLAEAVPFAFPDDRIAQKEFKLPKLKKRKKRESEDTISS